MRKFRQLIDFAKDVMGVEVRVHNNTYIPGISRIEIRAMVEVEGDTDLWVTTVRAIDQHLASKLDLHNLDILYATALMTALREMWHHVSKVSVTQLRKEIKDAI